MKAILSIIVGENVDFKKDFAKIRLFTSNGRGISYYDKVKLQPMPKLKHPNGSDIVNDYVRGYNDCLREILGETDDRDI